MAAAALALRRLSRPLARAATVAAARWQPGPLQRPWSGAAAAAAPTPAVAGDAAEPGAGLAPASAADKAPTPIQAAATRIGKLMWERERVLVLNNVLRSACRSDIARFVATNAKVAPDSLERTMQAATGVAVPGVRTPDRYLLPACPCVPPLQLSTFLPATAGSRCGGSSPSRTPRRRRRRCRC